MDARETPWLILVVPKASVETAQKLAQHLAAKGIRAYLDVSLATLGRKLKNAAKDGFKLVAIVGKNAQETGTFTLQRVETSHPKNHDSRELRLPWIDPSKE